MVNAGRRAGPDHRAVQRGGAAGDGGIKLVQRGQKDDSGRHLAAAHNGQRMGKGTLARAEGPGAVDRIDDEGGITGQPRRVSSR